MQQGNLLKHIVVIVTLSIAVAVGLNCLILVADLAQYSQRYQEAAMTLWAPPIWQQILYSVILIPVLEEVIFRGIVFRILRRWIQFSGALMVSALLFGAYHGNLVQFVYATFCGVLLAYLYEKYDSILAAVISHVSMNAVAVMLTHLGVFSWISEGVVRALVLVVVCVSIGVLFLRFLHKMDVTKVLKICCKETCNDI